METVKQMNSRRPGQVKLAQPRSAPDSVNICQRSLSVSAEVLSRQIGVVLNWIGDICLLLHSVAKAQRQTTVRNWHANCHTITDSSVYVFAFTDCHWSECSSDYSSDYSYVQQWQLKSAIMWTQRSNFDKSRLKAFQNLGWSWMSWREHVN